jgi:hypothetical protein
LLEKANGPKLLLSFDVAKSVGSKSDQSEFGCRQRQRRWCIPDGVHGGGHALTLQLLDVRQPTQQFGSIEDLGASPLPESLAKNDIVASYLYNF